MKKILFLFFSFVGLLIMASCRFLPNIDRGDDDYTSAYSSSTSVESNTPTSTIDETTGRVTTTYPYTTTTRSNPTTTTTEPWTTITINPLTTSQETTTETTTSESTTTYEESSTTVEESTSTFSELTSSETTTSQSFSESTTTTKIPVLDTYSKGNNTYDVGSSIYGQILGTVKREVPDVLDGGLSSYPNYGYAFDTAGSTLSTNVYNENKNMMTSNTTYDAIDNEGYFLLNGVRTGTKLFKHSASVGMYSTDKTYQISDKEVAVIKKIIYKAKNKTNYLTGLYAAPGELVKISISSADLEKVGGKFVVIVGQAGNQTSSNDLPSTVRFTRMPIITNTFNISSTEAYVGNPLGGPIYILPTIDTNYSITISGALEYQHFVYGNTNEDDFISLANNTVPYVDAEIGLNSVRFSGPKYGFSGLTFDDFDKSMLVWDQISLFSRQFPSGSNKKKAIHMVGDVYVGGGALALAYVGNNRCVVPATSIKEALNYKSFTTSGNWLNIHEFNHHFQKFGFHGTGNEVTNNFINIMEYLLFTQTDILRNNNQTISINHLGQLDPKYCIATTNSNIAQSVSGFNEIIYTNILMRIGVYKMVEVITEAGAATGNIQNDIDNFYKALVKVTGINYDVYFAACGYPVSEDIIDKNVIEEFIPVASSFQTGYKGYSTDILHPYQISSNGVLLDLTSFEILTGYTYRVENVTQPQYGTLEKTASDTYYYRPNGNLKSGEFEVSVFIESLTDTTFKQHLTLIFNFEVNDNYIDVYKYSYTSKPSDYDIDTIDSTYEFSNYDRLEVVSQATSIFSGYNQNMGIMFSAKFMIPKDGNYTFAYKGGRGDSVIFYSINNQNLDNKISIKVNQSAYMDNNSSVYIENLNKGDIVYLKCYLYTTSASASISFGINNTASSKTDGIKALTQVTSAISLLGSFEYGFESPILYDREEEKSNYVSTNDVTLTSPDFEDWDGSGTYGLDKVLDGDPKTFANSKKNVTISDTDYVTLIFSFKEEVSINSIVFYGHPSSSSSGCPTDFSVYKEVNGEYVKVEDFKDLLVSGNTSTAKFDNALRAEKIKVVITKTNPRYLVLCDVSFMLDTKVKSLNKLEYTNLDAYTTNFEGIYGYTYDLSQTKVKINIEASYVKLNLKNMDNAIFTILNNGNIVEYEVVEDGIILKIDKEVHEIIVELISGQAYLESIEYID